ncbi:hypothetical protein WJ0W_007107 [Paenibacillus melissococcoides]|uniref:Uncharacterized protein n=1 Tax=Paenibacillus melissococcoides TaxID=2912268 RepID=A0ABN8UF97_9BACL|nr:hypothetical protein [Paenibacillus melissococcoides]CAH8249921.1 hypothetical protein WJ0W_007107 [Paenibacillus melissococcoides]
MSEIYITLEVAAGLEGVSYESVKKKVQRNRRLSRQRKSCASGGKERVLSNVHAEQEGQTGISMLGIEGADVIIKEHVNEKEIPWYIVLILLNTSRSTVSHITKRSSWQRSSASFLNYGDRDRTEFAVSIAEANGMSQRTLYRYAQSYLEASAWALKMSKTGRENYDFFKVGTLP